jgi:NADH-quinone oxidoreductase subunit M
MDWPVLSVITFLPLLGVVAILLAKGDDPAAVRYARYAALWTTIVTFLVSLLIPYNFVSAESGFQFVENASWLGGYANYRMGVDGISMPLVILTTFLMPICILASWYVDKRVKEYMIAFLVLECLMIGVFCALDIVLFYVFFEAGLIPMFLIIGIWGGARRVYASFKFFLYTLLGSCCSPSSPCIGMQERLTLRCCCPTPKPSRLKCRRGCGLLSLHPSP